MQQFDQSVLQKLNSPEAKQLLQHMKKDGGAAFSKAAAAVKNGDYQKAKEILEPILSGTTAEALAKKLSSGHG